MPLRLTTTSLLFCLSLFSLFAQEKATTTSSPDSTLTQEEHNWLKKNPKVIIVQHAQGMPYSSTQDTAQPIGILPDIWRHVAKKLNLDLQWVPSKGREADLTLLTENKLHVISGSRLSSTQGNSLKNLFQKEFVIVSGKKSAKYAKLAKLKGKKVGAIAQGPALNLLRLKHPRLPLHVQASAHTALTALNNNKIDALIIDRLSFDHLSHAYSFDQFQISGQLDLASYSKSLISKASPELESILSKALQQISPEELTAITNYWTRAQEPVRDEAYSQKITLLATILILLALTWALRSHLKIRCLKDQKSELAKLKEQHDIKEQERASLLGNLAHEVRMPMNSVLGFSQHLQSHETDETKLRQLDYIVSSSLSLVSTVRNILQLAKVESGGPLLDITKTSLKEVFHDLEIIFNEKTAKSGLSFKADWDPNIPHELMIDKTRLRQILISLCNNALKFTKEGGLKISAGYSIPDQSSNTIDLVLKVTDTGMGISEELKEKVFNSFSQGDDNQNIRQSGGTGLDLAICKRFVSLMGGHLYFETEIGKGTTFFIMLPNLELAKGHQEKQFQLVDDQNIKFKPAKILIADDTEANREVLKLFLAESGFEIIEARNGVEALQQAVEEKPNLILLDTKMPIMNGYETLQRLEKSEQKDIPVVALTASSLSAKNDIIARDCAGYLRQPMKKIELINELRRHLPHEIIEN